jgi:hypothetical protein
MRKLFLPGFGSIEVSAGSDVGKVAAASPTGASGPSLTG